VHYFIHIISRLAAGLLLLAGHVMADGHQPNNRYHARFFERSTLHTVGVQLM